MKTKIIFSAIVLVLVFVGCNKEVELPDGLTNAMTNLAAAFEAVDNEMDIAAGEMASGGMDTSLIRITLQNLINSPTVVDEYSWITPEGIIKIIEPSRYYAYQGFDISQQDHIVKLIADKGPVLSLSFMAIEGFYAVSDIHPILQNNQLLGGVDALIKTKDFLGSIFEPLLVGQEFELWAMEKGGYMIYDQDESEIGINVFMDPLYTDFPQLIAAFERIDEEETGTTHYSFYKAGTSETVTKLAYWTTFKHHGAEWKIVWVKPE